MHQIYINDHPLGFFSTGDDTMPGNLGLWDQSQALRFLHEVSVYQYWRQWEGPFCQILPDFGGDPNRITLSGHSAGSASVSAHLFSPNSNRNIWQNLGLFFVDFFQNYSNELLNFRDHCLRNGLLTRMSSRVGFRCWTTQRHLIRPDRLSRVESLNFGSIRFASFWWHPRLGS